MSSKSLRAAQSWLFEKALPFWSTHGVDYEYGGYVEELRLDGSNPGVDFKRTRVIARQIYVFSHAALLGVPGSQALARHGFEFLINKAWLGESGGWARTLNRAGAVTDATPDLYDLAFVLYALGWYGRATGDGEAAQWARRTVAFIERTMRHPSGGFYHVKDASGPLQQNPHMHLLEAALVNLQVTKDRVYRTLADEVVSLFERRLYDAKTGTLVELFDETWRRLDGPGGQTVEPGHLYEWAWILSSYRSLTGARVEYAIRGLIDFAQTHGIDPRTGSVINAVGVDGRPIDAGFRVWPNAERLQGAVAAWKVFGDDPYPVFDQTVSVMFRMFLDHAVPGTWLDRRNADGGVAVDKVPASTLYHMMIAVAEMLAVETSTAVSLSTPQPTLMPA